MTYTLIGSPASLFTGKVRGYLRWKGIPFEEVLSTADIYRDIIVPKVGWPVIPVVQTPDGRTIQDSADIIAYFEGHETGIPVIPAGAVQGLATLMLQLFGDEWLVIPAMHYRWNYNADWICGQFGQTSAPDATPEEQRAIGQAIGDRFRSMVPVLGVDETTIPGIEASYEAFLEAFSAHLAKHPFLFGTQPSLGDFALLGPLYAHLYRDPKSGELMRRIAPYVARWVVSCHNPADIDGEYLEHDECPETILPMFQWQAAEQIPFLIETSKLLAKWASQNSPGTVVPRALGELPFSIGGRQGKRAALTFSLYRLQMVLDHLQSLCTADRSRADQFLSNVGAESLSEFLLPCRLERKNFQLVLGAAND
ncbi:MAG: glutathione S-transferase [Sphingomonadales bacterium]|nr:glutathione S-transferase [Sphingomonadales bacterium]NCP00192.1 glutathione S-transferase [Sphingomonadales bacterium]NCP49909.1 glutathione S-transferase [Sphingomonadales bacterium]NCQ10000.1 glutathione S-transferase [Sphingomonadales bacterium]NCQ49786.1 glutathione S-transferase [Sphingomonadales bacterium]